MNIYKILLLIMVSIFIISCSDDNNNGFYETTKYEIQKNSCSGDFTPVKDDSFHFFKIKQESFFGISVDTIYKCKNNNESSCETEYGTWLAESSYSSGGKICHMGKTFYEIDSDSDGIKIIKTTKSAELTFENPDDCDLDFIDKYEDKLKCDTIEIREGKRL